MAEPRAATNAAITGLLAAAPGYTVCGDIAGRTAPRTPALFEALREAGLPE